MKDGAQSSPSVALSLPDSKMYPLTVGLTESVFQSSDGEAQPRTHDLPATFCTITEPALTTRLREGNITLAIFLGRHIVILYLFFRY